MRIGIPKERLSNETRVAATPATVTQLLKLGFTVAIENEAGIASSFDNDAYQQAGAEILDCQNIWQSDIILKVNAPLEDEIALLKKGSTLISFIWPAQNAPLLEKLAEKEINVMAIVYRVSPVHNL